MLDPNDPKKVVVNSPQGKEAMDFLVNKLLAGASGLSGGSHAKAVTAGQVAANGGGSTNAPQAGPSPQGG